MAVLIVMGDFSDTEQPVQPLRRIRQQKQAVQKDIPGIGFPNHMEKKTTQHTNQPQIYGKALGRFLRGPGGTLFPYLGNTKQQCPQVKEILVSIAVAYKIIPRFSLIDSAHKGASASVSGEGCLPAGISAVRPLGQKFIFVKCGGVAGMIFKILQPLADSLPAEGGGG